METQLRRSFLLILFIAVITACGGGGGGDDDDDGGNPAVPVVSVVEENGIMILNWNNTEADQYRTLYWQGNDAPQEYMTKNTTYTLPQLSKGTYTILVEAYDTSGNSWFSVPVTVVVI